MKNETKTNSRVLSAKTIKAVNLFYCATIKETNMNFHIFVIVLIAADF